MADLKDVKELLRVGFEVAEDVVQLKPPYELRFTLADDLEGQKRDIQILVALAHMARTPPVPYVLRNCAYEKLRELASYYRKTDLEAVPIEMYIWSLGVASGELKPPTLSRGRGGGDRWPNKVRNNLIRQLVPWVQSFGGTKKAAVDWVAEALELTPDRIEDILKETSKK